MIKRLSDEDYKRGLRERGVDIPTYVLNNAICKRTEKSEVVQVDDLKLQWTISSADVDRSGDTIDPKGWEFDNWINGGSVLWSHDPYTLPVAKPDKDKPVWIDGNKVKSIAVYPDVGLSEFAHTVYRMAKEGYIRGASVGFKALEYEELEEDPERGFWPLDFKRQELLEWSHTPVPDNPNALLDAKSVGISLRPIKAWCAKILDEKVPIVGVSEKEVQNMYDICDDKKKVTVDLGSKSKIEKGVITYDQAHGGGTPKASEDSDWDGTSEVTAASVEDLSVMSTWFDSDDAENKAAYKLPHHRTADKAVVKQAVDSALAALNGARGGVDIPDSDRAGVYTHLTRHLREDFGVDNADIPELSEVETETEVEDDKDVSNLLIKINERLDHFERRLDDLETIDKSTPTEQHGDAETQELDPKMIKEEVEKAWKELNILEQFKNLVKQSNP